MFVCGILSVLLSLSLCNRWDRPRFLLLIFMITSTLLYIGHFIFFNRIIAAIPISDTIYCFCNPAVFPLFLIYIEELVIHKPKRRQQILYILPAALCCISTGLLYALMDETETSAFISHHIYGAEIASLDGYAWAQALAHLTVKIIFALEIPPVLIAGWRYINTYNLRIENFYSNTENKTLQPVKLLLSVLVLASLISAACNFIGRIYFTESIWLVAIPALAFSTLILLIGYFGLYQQFSVGNLEEDDKATSDSPQSTEPITPEVQQALPTEMEYLAKEIRELIDKEKIFLQPNLKINDLATMLNTNRNYIYNAINKEIGMSFSDFVNLRRIQYAVSLIDKNPKTILSDVAYKSGFSSASAFYRNFKSIMGCSPSEYQRKTGASITASTLPK